MLLVEAHGDRGRGHGFRAGPAQSVQLVDVFAGRGINGVNLATACSGNDSGRIGAEVDVFDAVQVGAAIDFSAPPGVVSADQNLLDANFVGFGLERASANRVSRRITTVIAAVNDSSRIVSHANDDGDVGRLGGQLDGGGIDNGDRAFTSQLGGRILQRSHTAGHRVAFNVAIAPTADVECHVVSGEIIAIRPLHALTNVQGEFGGGVVDGPRFDQHAAQGAVAVVFHHVFQPAAAKVREFRPVPGARVFQRFGFHVHAQGAALSRGVLSLSRSVEAQQAIGCNSRHAQSGRADEEFAAAQLAGADLFSIHLRCGMQRIGLKGVFHLRLPVRLSLVFELAAIFTPCSVPDCTPV